MRLTMEVADEIPEATLDRLLEFHKGKRGVLLLGQNDEEGVVNYGIGDVLEVRDVKLES